MTVSPRALRRTRLIAGGAAGLAFVIGALVLLGWVLDSRSLKTGFSGVSMKPNAALALCSTAGALLCLLWRKRSARSTRVARVAGLFVALVGTMTVSQHLFGWSLGIDELMFSEPRGEAATVSPGRMGPPASTTFILLGMGVFLFDAKTRRGRSVSQWIALAACPVALLAILGYATGATQLYGIARYTGIALHTAVGLFLLAVGLFLARAELEPAALLVADNPGGEVARTMLPAALLLPILVGWLRTVGERYDLYNTAFGRALLLLSLMTLFTIIVWRVAWRLSNVATERKAAEQASQAAKAEAERLAFENLETLNVLESLFAHAPFGVVLFDTARRSVRVNEVLIQSFEPGRRPEVGQVLEQVLPGTSPALEQAIDDVFARGISTMNVEAVRRNGTEHERSWLAGVFPVRDARGAITLAGAVMIEITERKRLEAQKVALLESERAARQDAERAATLKDQFLASISHELRTPLNAIMGWTTIAKRVPGRPGELDRPLETIERNARVQAQLIEDLLDLSRIVSGKMRLRLETVDVRAVVQAALSAISPTAEQKHVRIEVELDPELVPITGDAARLQQIVWNLLSNAVKFTAREGWVKLKARCRGDLLELAVSDDGIGIAPEFLPYVFDRFRQADSSTTRRYGGLGLGLSIAKQLVELHRGTVQVSSLGENRGATFLVLLPIAAGQSDVVATASAAPERLADSALSGVRVLVVDDELDAREFLGRVLSDFKASVALAGSVDEAMLALERDGAHVVVSDIGMPGRDGYDLIRAIRERHDAKVMPAIAVTAFARAEDRMRALNAGFQLHIVKPVDPYELTRAVANLAGRIGSASGVDSRADGVCLTSRADGATRPSPT